MHNDMEEQETELLDRLQNTPKIESSHVNT